MGKIISIANRKGGVGKTTTTASLGIALSRAGKKVLLIDADSQGSLSYIFRTEGKKENLFSALVELRTPPQIKKGERLYLCPSSLDLIATDKALSFYLHNEELELRALKMILDPIRGDYDYILIDCPPDMGILTKNALTASDGVIIPLTAEALPTNGVITLLHDIGMIKEGLNQDLSLYGFLITRYNRRRLNRLVEEALRNNFGDQVFKTKIRENVDIMEAPLYGDDIFSYNPDSLGAKDYSALADEIISKF
jgi:chromosome partitioning protein